MASLDVRPGTPLETGTRRRVPAGNGGYRPRHRARRDRERSLGRDVWDELRRNPVFVVSSAILALLVLIAAFPGLFTSVDPRSCDLTLSRQGPSADAWFGYDVQGCDIFARTIHGAQASILVGVLTTVAVVLIGGTIGAVAGFVGGWVDAALSRVLEIFFGVPLLLGGILVLAAFPSDADTPEWLTLAKVVLALAILGWPVLARIMRSTVISVKYADYVVAARGLGAGTGRILWRHVLPNAVAPVIVYATITLGVFIVAEATLSYLGIGLQPPTVSWGVDISNATDYVRQSPHLLIFPAAFLSLTVLVFIMLGDTVRDAFDPKLR